MKALHRVPLLALLALTSCGIPATGVVEAGGPASGVVPITPVYFVSGGRLVAMPRETDLPGDPAAALRLLMDGPASAETGKRLRTEVPGLPSLAPTTDEASAAPVPDAPSVSANGDTLTVRLPAGMDALSDVATVQIICTAAAAHRLTASSTEPVTVEVTDGGGRRVRGSDEDCPGL